MSTASDNSDNQQKYNNRNSGTQSTGSSGYNNNRPRTGFNNNYNDGDGQERQPLAPMEVAVDHSIERAIKVLKRKLIKEGLFRELKARKHYQKPSEKKKEKRKESLKKTRKEESRSRKNTNLI